MRTWRTSPWLRVWVARVMLAVTVTGTVWDVSTREWVLAGLYAFFAFLWLADTGWVPIRRRRRIVIREEWRDGPGDDPGLYHGAVTYALDTWLPQWVTDALPLWCWRYEGSRWALAEEVLVVPINEEESITILPKETGR